MQLTRRYWRLLEGVADAVSCVGAAKVEASSLTVRRSAHFTDALLMVYPPPPLNY